MVWTFADAVVMLALAALTWVGPIWDRRALAHGEKLSHFEAQRLRESGLSRYFAATCELVAVVILVYNAVAAVDWLNGALDASIHAGSWITALLPASFVAASVCAIVFGLNSVPPIPGVPGWLSAALRACALTGGIGMVLCFVATGLGTRVDPWLSGFLIAAVVVAGGVISGLQLWWRSFGPRETRERA